MKVLIVDDEPLARDVIRFFLADQPDVQILGEYATGESALEGLREHRPDLVFLDVQMPGGSGIEVLRRLAADSAPMIIFVTAFSEHAVAAFDLHAADYLLKPVAEERFRLALARAREQLTLRDLKQQSQNLSQILGSLVDPTCRPKPSLAADRRHDERVLLPARDHISLVDLNNIDWIEAAGDYVNIYLGHERRLLRQTLRNLEENLDPHRFKRIHRSAMVNLEKITEIRPEDHGEYRVLLTGGTLLKVSRSYRQSFQEWMEGRSLV